MKSADWSIVDFRAADGTSVYTFYRHRADLGMEAREVEVDLQLARAGGVLLQELPAMCRWLV